MSHEPAPANWAFEVLKADSSEELIPLLAAYKIVPKKNPWPDNGDPKNDYIIERRGDKKVGGKRHAFGEKTRQKVIQKLSITSDADCQRVREEIKKHPNWGAKA